MVGCSGGSPGAKFLGLASPNLRFSDSDARGCTAPACDLINHPGHLKLDAVGVSRGRRGIVEWPRILTTDHFWQIKPERKFVEFNIAGGFSLWIGDKISFHWVTHLRMRRKRW